ncbi:hypothetical protein Dimus_004942 [Dionaea muscipula]
MATLIISMERRRRRRIRRRSAEIMRRSVHTFLKHYQYFTMISAFLAFPFSMSVLISQAGLIFPHSLLPTIYARLRALFDAAGFPPSSDFFSLVCLKLSQTISCSVITFPFTLSFLLLAKASVIGHLKFNQSKQLPLVVVSLSLYNRPLLLTHICSYFLIISANATSFSILFMGFTSLEYLGLNNSWVLFLSALGAVFYSILLANTLVICNLASIVASAGAEDDDEKEADHGGSGVGLMAIIKACVLIRGRASTALALAVPVNLGLAAIEVLFQYRIVRPYHRGAQRTMASIAMEGTLIAYLYSLLVVLDVIIGYIFYRSCCCCCEDDDDAAAAFEIIDWEEEQIYASTDVEKLIRSSN